METVRGAYRLRPETLAALDEMRQGTQSAYARGVVDAVQRRLPCPHYAQPLWLFGPGARTAAQVDAGFIRDEEFLKRVSEGSETASDIRPCRQEAGTGPPQIPCSGEDPSQATPIDPSHESSSTRTPLEGAESAFWSAASDGLDPTLYPAVNDEGMPLLDKEAEVEGVLRTLRALLGGAHARVARAPDAFLWNFPELQRLLWLLVAGVLRDEWDADLGRVSARYQFLLGELLPDGRVASEEPLSPSQGHSTLFSAQAHHPLIKQTGEWCVDRTLWATSARRRATLSEVRKDVDRTQVRQTWFHARRAALARVLFVLTQEGAAGLGTSGVKAALQPGTVVTGSLTFYTQGLNELAAPALYVALAGGGCEAEAWAVLAALSRTLVGRWYGAALDARHFRSARGAAAHAEQLLALVAPRLARDVDFWFALIKWLLLFFAQELELRHLIRLWPRFAIDFFEFTGARDAPAAGVTPVEQTRMDEPLILSPYTYEVGKNPSGWMWYLEGDALTTAQEWASCGHAPVPFLYYFSVAVLLSLRNELSAADFGGRMTLLQRLPARELGPLIARAESLQRFVERLFQRRGLTEVPMGVCLYTNRRGSHEGRTPTQGLPACAAEGGSPPGAPPEGAVDASTHNAASVATNDGPTPLGTPPAEAPPVTLGLLGRYGPALGGGTVAERVGRPPPDTWDSEPPPLPPPAAPRPPPELAPNLFGHGCTDAPRGPRWRSLAAPSRADRALWLVGEPASSLEDASWLQAELFKESRTKKSAMDASPLDLAFPEPRICHCRSRGVDAPRASTASALEKEERALLCAMVHKWRVAWNPISAQDASLIRIAVEMSLGARTISDVPPAVWDHITSICGQSAQGRPVPATLTWLALGLERARSVPAPVLSAAPRASLPPALPSYAVPLREAPLGEPRKRVRPHSTRLAWFQARTEHVIYLHRYQQLVAEAVM